MGRGVITYTISYLSGVILPLVFPVNPVPLLLVTPLCCILSCLLKKHAIPFFVSSHIAFFAIGAGICSTTEYHQGEIKHPIIEKIISTAEMLQEKAAEHLKTIADNPQNHATLCAISIGEKRFMENDLKKSYSAAGAMHVLALSGLHIGIAFAIIYSLLFPLTAIPGGAIARNMLAVMFVVCYSIFSGCSPSVIRAAVMIFLYKIAEGKFRNISNWDAISISALAILTISPLQVKSIGFQLSYCAVMGIALLFPVCNTAFKQAVPHWKGWKKNIWNGLYWLWCSLSISICCQIATLPATLYHFGYSAPYYLIANLAAVPLATCILYTLTLTLCLQWIPIAGDFCIHVLNILISLLNAIVMYISD